MNAYLNTVFSCKADGNSVQTIVNRTITSEKDVYEIVSSVIPYVHVLIKDIERCKSLTHCFYIGAHIIKSEVEWVNGLRDVSVNMLIDSFIAAAERIMLELGIPEGEGDDIEVLEDSVLLLYGDKS